MTCKDCIHDNACSSIFRFFGGNPDYIWNRVEDTCKPFQNKANFVEVVRCKDCKYYDVYRLECHNPYHNGIINCEGYCNYGERKCDNG
jgi:hypothetical protein